MTDTCGFILHPEAAQDILDIWEFIAADRPSSAGRIREEILQTIRDLARFRIRDLSGPTEQGSRFAFRWFAIS